MRHPSCTSRRRTKRHTACTTRSGFETRALFDGVRAAGTLTGSLRNRAIRPATTRFAAHARAPCPDLVPGRRPRRDPRTHRQRARPPASSRSARSGASSKAAFAARHGTEHAVAVSSGTSALEIILRALGVEGREVIVPANTFFATAAAAVHAGARVCASSTATRETMAFDLADVEARLGADTAAVDRRPHRRPRSPPRSTTLAQLCAAARRAPRRGRRPRARQRARRPSGRHVRHRRQRSPSTRRRSWPAARAA